MALERDDFRLIFMIWNFNNKVGKVLGFEQIPHIRQELIVGMSCDCFVT